MQNVIEFSNSRAVEYRAHDRRLVGYAAVFFSDDDPGTVFSPFDGHTEIIAPTAFDAALEKGGEVFASFNHDVDNILARTPDTLKLSVDGIGLKYEISLGQTTIANDVAEHVARGDVRGSSFQFVVSDSRITRSENGDTRREILSVNPLIEVGPVTNPAFQGTSVSARSLGVISADLAAYQKRMAHEIRSQRMETLTAKMEERSV
jgi:HK97 family phage prohead protease